MKFLDIDSKFIRTIDRLVDLFWLNLLTIVCSLPIFTIGASLTGLNYVVLKMARKEDGYITKGFFKAFKSGFKQSTLTWLLFLPFIGFYIYDFKVFRDNPEQYSATFQVLLAAVGIFALIAMAHVFPLIARYKNTFGRTLSNSMNLGLAFMPRSVSMITLFVLPYVLIYFNNGFVWLWLLYGFSGPAFLSALMYAKTLRLYEEGKVDSEGRVLDQKESDADNDAS